MPCSRLINYSASKIAKCILKTEKQVAQRDTAENVVLEHRQICVSCWKTKPQTNKCENYYIIIIIIYVL